MKVVVIHAIYKPDCRGGAEVVVENIVHGLQARGDEVAVIALGRNNFGGRAARAGEPETVDGAKVYRVRSRNIFNFLDIIGRPAWQRLPWHVIDMFNFAQARQIREILRAEKPALILTHSLKGLGYQVPGVIKKFVRQAAARTQWLHTIHDMQLIHPSGLLGGGQAGGGRRQAISGAAPSKENFVLRFLAAVYRVFCRQLFASPPTVAFPSKYIKSIYEQYGFFPDSKRVAIANPLAATVSAMPAGQSQIESAPKTLNFLFLGQVEEYKGVLVLIEAFKALKASPGAKTDKIVLNIVGDGRALPAAEILAQASNEPDKATIKFWGRLSQAELNEKIWPQTDLLINPSQTPESFGMVVIEAYAHGVPVLVSDIGALPELVIDGETGWVVANVATIIWQQALADFLITSQEPEKMKSIKENCFKESRKYSMEKYLAAVMAAGRLD